MHGTYPISSFFLAWFGWLQRRGGVDVGGVGSGGGSLKSQTCSCGIAAVWPTAGTQSRYIPASTQSVRVVVTSDGASSLAGAQSGHQDYFFREDQSDSVTTMR